MAADSAPRAPTSGSWLAGVLGAVFPLSIAALIAVYGVDVPRLDDWSLATVLRPGEDALSWSALARQHVESRPLTSRLVVLALAPIAGFDVRWLMFASLGAAGLVSACLLRLARATLPSAGLARWLWAAASSLVFGISQSVTWLHGCHVGTYLVLATLCLGLVVSRSRARPALRVGGAAALATASTFSLGSGLLTWFLLPAVWAPGLGRRARLSFGGLWLAAFGAALVLYLWDFEDRSGGTAGLALREPHRVLAYALAFLGGPFARALGGGSPPAVFASGALGAVLAAVALACGALLWRAGDPERWRRAAPWASLVAFGLGSAALAGVGRLVYGVESALAPRYTVWAVTVPVGLLFLAPIAFEGRRRFLRAGLGLALALLGAHGLTCGRELLERGPARKEQLLMKAVVTFSAVVPEHAWLRKLFPWPERLQERALFLDERGFLHPPLALSDRVSEIARSTLPISDAGGIERYQLRPEGPVVAGAAWLPERLESADAVLLCAETAEGDPRVVAVVGVGISEEDGSPRSRVDPRVGWGVRVPRSRLPEGAVLLTAWAYDALSGEAIRLPGEVRLQAGG